MAPKVILTMGDPNGIGPEIALKAAVQLAREGQITPIIVGDAHLAKATGIAFDGIMIDTGLLSESDHTLGTPTPASGRACVGYLQAALELHDRIGAAGIVGCPHSETAINASGRSFSGYPNLLAELRGTGPDSIFLMLVGGGLKVAHVTLHEPILTALNRVTPELVARAIRTIAAGLQRLGTAYPRIGVMGFNPHAGENGLFGHEDTTLIAPAIAECQSEGLDVQGPEGADTLLQRSGYDAMIAIYHDQGHIPVKLLGGKEVSALSLGSDVLFSSVGHGAAFDIAGQGLASAAGVLRAARLVGGVDVL
jgi:4-hydroxy-L-threonine phosphate dehydrogenase PdxA